MLASRACRSSIMIGRALEPRAQRAILDHLAALHSPWNCPHGRPTMRHLALLPPRQPALHP
jgi:DNA mismatch repair protein PMS2